MRNPIHTGALAYAALALAVSSAATAATDWRGVWRATWPNGHSTELTIVDIDDRGRAVGGYCHLTNQGRTSYVDLRPDAILAQLDDDVLRIERPQRRWTFRQNADVVNMRFQYGKQDPNEIDLVRVEGQTCAARVHQLTPPPGASPGPSVADLIPDEPEHWAVGVWTVTYRGLTVELAVVDVVDRYARGIYCNLREGPTLGFHDLDPKEGIRAKVSRKTLKFKIRDIQFTFKRTKDDDILKRSRRHKGKTQKHEVQRTDEPACANRIATRSTP